MKVIHAGKYKAMLWKNGQGTTWEIERFPPEGEFLWRLSQAGIRQSGEFSLYPGYQRLLTVVQGEGLSLNGSDLLPGQVLHFSGEELITCTPLAGEVKDLGLIYNGKKIQASMSVVNSLTEAERSFQSEADWNYLYVLRGCLKCEQGILNAGDTLVFSSAEISSIRSLEVQQQESLRLVQVSVKKVNF